MSVEREYTKSTLVLAQQPRLTCSFRPGESGDASVLFKGLSDSAVYASRPQSVKDAIAWAEDFITMLRRL